jgi:hypothetical protein
MADTLNIEIILRALAAAYPNFALTEQTVAIYVELLADIDPELLRAATLDLISRSRFFPTVAEIREAARDLRDGPQLSGSEAWGLVIQAIRDLGYAHQAEAHERLGETIMQAVRDIGGWGALCYSENSVADRARFIEAFDARAARRKREGVTLPQIADLARRLTTTSRPELPDGRG